MNKNTAIYRENRNEMEDIAIDRSLVEIRNEKLSVTILSIIGNCFINNIVFIASNLISTINLILLGHIVLQNKTHYELFMTYQIGICIIDFFGKVFIIGLLRYIFEKKEHRKIYQIYLKLKTGLVLIIPIIMIPVSLSSYFIIRLLLKNNLDIYNQSLNKQIYFKFLIFSPIIYFFEILFYLNLKLLRAFEETKAIISYINCYLISHFVACWILLYILKIGIIGLTISYAFNSFLFYFFTNIYINSKEEESENFFAFPPKEYIDINVLNTLKEASSFSMRHVCDTLFLYLLFIFTLFTDKKQLIVNIVYIDFYYLLNGINKGFYFTFRQYLLHSKESNEEKKKYTVVFSLTFLAILFVLFAVILIFKNVLMKIYLINGGDINLRTISHSIQTVFSFCVLFNGIQILLYGFIRGMASPSPLMHKFIYSFICLFLCLILCFVYKMGIKGLWYSVLLLCLGFAFGNGYKSIIHFNNFFIK